MVGRNLAIPNWDPHTSNADIIASIWKYGSTDFQRRVPEPTKANLQQTIQAINSYQPSYNEFANALINKVGRTLARQQSWTNPLAKFKIGMLEYGESIEEYNTGLVKAYVFDPRREYGEKALFGRHGIDVQASYHKINRENMYALTVEHPVLNRAFLSSEGLASFVSNLMAAPTTSDQWDEFLIMAKLFSYYEENGGFFKVHIDPITGEEGSKAFLRVLREYAEIMPFLSEKYNAAHMPVSAKPEDLVLFTTPRAKASIDVDGLAALFNVDFGQVPYRVITMPEEFFFGYGNDIQAVLTTEDFFVAADTYFDIASQPNPAGRYENYFLHHDGIYSVSRFVPAIAFTLGEGSIVLDDTPDPVTAVDAITIADATGTTVTANKIRRGEAYLITSGTDSDLDAVVFEVTGIKSPRSFVENTGELWISPDDTTAQVVLTSRAVADNTITSTRTLTVSGPLINYWPNPDVLEDADDDGVLEVTPQDLVKSDDDVVTIPAVKGVQYSKGGTPVNNGSEHTITESTTFTAAGRQGYELTPGATASWAFTP